MARIPSDAFDQYVAMGAGRTYERLATKLGVSKRSIVRRATKENWQERLARIEGAARTKADEKLAETVAAVTERHLRTLRAVQHKALQGLSTAPTGTAAQAAATLIAAVKAERSIVAPPSDPAHGTHAQLLEAAMAFTEEEMAAMTGALNAVRAKKGARPPALPPLPARGGLLLPGPN